MSIGINWADVWGPVWAQVWQQVAAPAPAPASDDTGGWGLPARKAIKPAPRPVEIEEEPEVVELSTARMLAQQRADAEMAQMVEQFMARRQQQEEESLLLILASL